MKIYVINANTGEVVLEFYKDEPLEIFMNCLRELPVDYYVIDYCGMYYIELWEFLKLVQRKGF